MIIKLLAPKEVYTLITTLHHRFEENRHRHEGLDWSLV